MRLIQISAVWCPACLIMRPRINEIALKLNINLVEYDYDMDEDIVLKYNVGNLLPVFILEDDNKEIKRIIGEKTNAELFTELGGYLK